MRYVVANWKMAPQTKQAALDLISALMLQLRNIPRGVSVILCPPAIWIPYLADVRGGEPFSLGAQDVFFENRGAHTGEISASMLSSLGVSAVLIGHSERRALGEDNAVVQKKLRVTLDAGLTAILCVGERAREGDWHAFLREEIESAFAVLTAADLPKLLVAYEPIWAIGGSEPDTPDDALTTAVLVRKMALDHFGERGKTLPVLYGGSVEEKTVAPFAAEAGLDGVLVGHASLDADQFLSILRFVAGTLA